MNLTPEEFHPLIELAAERTAEGLLCVDAEGQILYANDSASRSLVQPVPALCARTIFDLAPEMNPALWRELWKEIRGRSSFAFEFTLAAGAERLILVDMAVHYLKPATRELACIFFRDIEERKRLQVLQQEFVSTASHELRTPMTVIREGVSQVLEGLRGEINDSQRRSLTIALNGIDRLGRIIDELLDISKIESGKIPLRRERLDLAALTREVAAGFQSLAADRGLDLRVTTPAGAVRVYGDRDRLVQVLTNLINNAFKFTEKGRIEIVISLGEAEVECAVVDTGIGLARGDSEKIFNKFEQLGPGSVTGEKGTGLGLSICRGIVDLHKGRIWAESPGVGQGTRVAFSLPRQTGLEVFKEQLLPVLHNVARRGGTLSTVVYHVEAINAAAAADPAMGTLLTNFEALVRRLSGRKTDFLVKDEDAVYVALESTVKREAERIKERTIAAFQDMLAHDGDSARFRLQATLTSFPEEAPDEEAFMTKAFGRQAA